MIDLLITFTGVAVAGYTARRLVLSYREKRDKKKEDKKEDARTKLPILNRPTEKTPLLNDQTKGIAAA